MTVKQPVVFLIALADQLVRLRNAESRNAEAHAVAKEGLFYSQIAEVLGLHGVAREVDDLSSAIIYPKDYARVRNQLERFRKNMEASGTVQQTLEDLGKLFSKENGFGLSELTHRVKTPASTLRKMRNRNLALNEIDDRLGVRAVLDRERDSFLPIKELLQRAGFKIHKEDDYVSNPTVTGYRAYHLTLSKGGGPKFELQVRTPSMHAAAEDGDVAHWLYKGYVTSALSNRLLVLRRMLQTGEFEFGNITPRDLQGVTVKFQGQEITLPRGSTPLDLAVELFGEKGFKLDAATVEDASSHSGFRSVGILSALHDGDEVRRLVLNDRKQPTANLLRKLPFARTRLLLERHLKEQGLL